MRRLKNQVSWVVLSVLLIFVFMNCGPSFQFPEAGKTSSGSTAFVADPVKSAAAKSILQNRCTSCHSGVGGGALTNVMSDSFLMNNGYIIPGNPNSSKLLARVYDGSMPPGQPISTGERTALYDWVMSMVPTATPTPGGIGAPGGPVAGGTPTPTPTPIPPNNGGGGVIEPTFQNVYNVILQPRCQSCHGGAGGYSYGNYQQTLTSVNRANPAASRLYQSVLGNDMPRGSAALAASEKKLILDWITAGALNN